MTFLITAGTLIGYARCSIDEQDLTAGRQRLVELGVSEERIHLDHGLTGTKRVPLGLDRHSPQCAKATPSSYRK